MINCEYEHGLVPEVLHVPYIWRVSDSIYTGVSYTGKKTHHNIKQHLLERMYSYVRRSSTEYRVSKHIFPLVCHSTL